MFQAGDWVFQLEFLVPGQNKLDLFHKMSAFLEQCNAFVLALQHKKSLTEARLLIIQVVVNIVN